MSGIVGGNLGRGSGLIKAGAIDDNSVTLAKMAGLARGKLIYGDTSGDPAALAVGGADEVLTHDGTDFDWAAAGGVFGSNCWWSSTSGETRTDQVNKVFAMDTQIYDPDGVYDESAGEYKFTAPATGTYMFFVVVYMTDGSGMTENATTLYKNGAHISNTRYAWNVTGDIVNYYSGGWSVIMALSTNDYVQLYGSSDAADGGDQATENRGTFFGGWRVA
jgi:hypothetical protein